MELDVLKNFVNRDVEVLVGGVWIEGHMTPIVKGVITLLPLGDTAQFYGPTALKAEVVQAVRQVKKQGQTPQVAPAPETPGPVRSSLESLTAQQRFVRK